MDLRSSSGCAECTRSHFMTRGRKRLILARDPVGIKPLYVAQANGAIIFASEIRAILASDLVSRRLDMQGVAGLLAYGAVQQPSTIFEGVRAFPPGSYQVIEAQGSGAPSRALPFWNYPSVSRDIDQTEAVRGIETALEESVRDHLISDVPVGVFLSSGLDSTVVAALAAKHSSHMRSFTVGFADQPDMSELAMARDTAKIFQLEHTEIVINGQDAEDAAAAWFQSLDQPSVDGLNVYAISKAVRAQGITVALSGQGGDELFGGYPSFSDVPQLRAWMRRIGWLPTPIRVALCQAAAFHSTEAIRQKMADIARSEPSVINLYLQRRRAMSSQQLHTLGIDPAKLGLRDSFMSPASLSGLYVEDYDAIWSISQLESRFYQGNMLLRDGDANSMAPQPRGPRADARQADARPDVRHSGKSAAAKQTSQQASAARHLRSDLAHGAAPAGKARLYVSDRALDDRPAARSLRARAGQSPRHRDSSRGGNRRDLAKLPQRAGKFDLVARVHAVRAGDLSQAHGCDLICICLARELARGLNAKPRASSRAKRKRVIHPDMPSSHPDLPAASSHRPS